jgi:LacI family transcriptional regulator
MTTTNYQKITILLDAEHHVARELIGGIVEQFGQTRGAYELVLEQDYRQRLASIASWHGSGVIADAGDPLLVAALGRCSVPVIAVGGSVADVAAHPALGFVGPDNPALVEFAYRHLADTGLRHFAMFSEPARIHSAAAREREQAFVSLTQGEAIAAHIYRGGGTLAADDVLTRQIAWLRALPKPVGVIAVTETRARQLMRACVAARIAVPEQVAIIGIGDDALLRQLDRVALSTVPPNAHEIGRSAARQLEQMMLGTLAGGSRLLVAPAAVLAQASTGHLGALHPQLMRALNFIRLHACEGIQTEHIARHVGVSRSGLESRFRRELDCTVHDAVLRSKIDAAINVLSSTQSSIAEVAERCGFTSVQYIHTVFKRELGCSPRAFQNRPRGSAKTPSRPTTAPRAASPLARY